MDTRGAAKRVIVTGGPTRAYLDDIRYLSNFSSGELAYEVCRRLSDAGFEVVAVVGPCSPSFEMLPLRKLVRVETATEMHDAVMGLCRTFRPSAAVFSAAVLDFEPVRRERGKMTSARKNWVIRLRPTPKIIDAVGKRFPKIRRFGFKLESKRQSGAYAMKYLRAKGLDGLCMNFLSEVGAKTHKARLFTAGGESKKAKTKKEIAAWFVRTLG